MFLIWFIPEKFSEKLHNHSSNFLLRYENNLWGCWIVHHKETPKLIFCFCLENTIYLLFKIIFQIFLLESFLQQCHLPIKRCSHQWSRMGSHLKNLGLQYFQTFTTPLKLYKRFLKSSENFLKNFLLRIYIQFPLSGSSLG